MFDSIIIGGSAAATTAGIYAARRGLNFKIITKEFGGEVATSGQVENWPGISRTDGITLANQFREHLRSYKVEPEEGIEVEQIIRQPDGTFLISAKRDNGEKIEYAARTVIVTTGVHPKELNIPGEKEFRNKGVSYCTVCDGPLFSGKTVAIIGGGNSALESGLMMADISEKVYMINKNPQYKGDTILLDNLKLKKNVEFFYNALTSEIIGENFATGLKYKDKEGKEQELKAEGIFVHIGTAPNSGIVPADVAKNNFNEIMVDINCATNLPGLYAAGDVTNVPFNQIIIAAGQGCIAALSAVQYLNKIKK